MRSREVETCVFVCVTFRKPLRKVTLQSYFPKASRCIKRLPAPLPQIDSTKANLYVYIYTLQIHMDTYILVHDRGTENV